MCKVFVLLLTLITLSACLLTGCHDKSSAEFPGASYLVYRNRYDGYAIRFPFGWLYAPDPQGMDVLAMSPTDDSDIFQESVGVIGVYMDSGTTLDEYHQRNVQALASSFEHFQFVGGLEELKIDGLWAKSFRFTYTWSGYTYTCQEFEVVKDNHAYVVACTAIPSTFPQYRSLFGEIAQSLDTSYHDDRASSSRSVPSRETLSVTPANALAACAQAARAAGSTPAHP